MPKDSSSHAAGQRSATAEPTPLSAIRKRKQKVSNLWIFDSPKNNRRLTVSGDVPFMHLVLLEGDITVARYDLIDDPFNVSSDSAAGYVRVRRGDGGEHWLVIGRQGRNSPTNENRAAISQTLQEKADAAGIKVLVLNELELAGKDVLVDNWLTLCAIMNRAKAYPSYLETEQFLALFARHGTLRVHDILGIEGVDPAIMLAVIAKALQDGLIQTELSCRLFGLQSQLDRVQS